MASSARIDELRKKFEENPRRYFAPLANEYRKAGQIDQAIAICREYLPQQPGHMSGHIVYGQALYEARQFDEAKAVFETALTLDPENLIALRHLGDIALIVGDAEAARGWYKRVLEADPRNEEIQAQLKTLDQAAASPSAPTPVVTAPVAAQPLPPPPPPSSPSPATPSPTAPVPQGPVKATPSSAPTVVMSAVTRPQPAAPAPVAAAPAAAAPQASVAPREEPVDRPLETVTPESPTAEVRLDTIPTHAPAQPAAPVEMALGLEPTSIAQTPPTTAPPPLELDSPISAAKEAPPIESFSLDGLETTSLAAPPPPPAPPQPTLAQPEVPPSTPMPSAPSGTVPELDIGMDAASGQVAPSPAPPAPEPVELLDLDMPAAAAPPMSPPPAPTPPAQEAEAIPLLDLDEPPAAPVADEAAPVPALDELSIVSDVAEPPAAAAVPESGPFVTETMAELYLQQGHHEEALRVYRALVEQRPNDPSLRAKVANLEAQLAPQPAPQPPVQRVPAAARAAIPAIPPRRAAPAPPPTPKGPTIRELLNLVAMRRPGVRPSAPDGNGAPAVEQLSPLTGDAIGAVLGARPVSAADEQAAMTLALAFVEANGAEPAASSTDAAVSPEISGAPARPGSKELSLDSVFGGGGGTAPAPASFSFDQFFSQRAAAEAPAPAGPSASTETGSPTDVAQFTQWLEGLKQR